MEAGFPRARAARLPTKLVFFASVAARNVALPALLNFLLASIGDQLMVETTAAPLRDFLGPKIVSLGASPVCPRACATPARPLLPAPADAAIRLFGAPDASCPYRILPAFRPSGGDGADTVFARWLEEAEVADRALAENLQREEGELAAGEVSAEWRSSRCTPGSFFARSEWLFEQGNDTLLSQPLHWQRCRAGPARRGRPGRHVPANQRRAVGRRAERVPTGWRHHPWRRIQCGSAARAHYSPMAVAGARW